MHGCLAVSCTFHYALCSCHFDTRMTKNGPQRPQRRALQHPGTRERAFCGIRVWRENAIYFCQSSCKFHLSCIKMNHCHHSVQDSRMPPV